MTDKHTPGPWSYTRNPENTRWVVDASPAHAIAVTAGFEPDNEANARLIAAAPDLLSACLSMIPANACLTNKNVPDSMVVPLECTMGELRAVAAAISKATGAA